MLRLRAQRIQRNSSVHGREASQALQARLEQGKRSSIIASRTVVERCSNLNNPLQEGFVGFRGVQPDLFPGFVSLKEMAGVELLDASAKWIGMR